MTLLIFFFITETKKKNYFQNELKLQENSKIYKGTEAFLLSTMGTFTMLEIVKSIAFYSRLKIY